MRMEIALRPRANVWNDEMNRAGARPEDATKIQQDHFGLLLENMLEKMRAENVIDGACAVGQCLDAVVDAIGVVRDGGPIFLEDFPVAGAQARL